MAVFVFTAVGIGIGAGVGAGGQTRPTKSDQPADTTVITLPGPAAAPPESRELPPDKHPRFYKIDGRPMTRWGDYGQILQHGMTAHLDRFQGLLSLERTGPYMPPITFPGIGDVVLSASGRRLLETSGLSGFLFQSVHKARIVSLAWNEWDLTTNRPPEYPASGEPEDYILGRPSSRSVAEHMGNISELVIPVTARIGRPREFVKSFRELYVERDSWNGADIFRGHGYGGPLVTERAKAWFEEHLGAYTRFEEFASR